MAVALENEVAQLKLLVATLREEGEIVRKMWAADVDRLSIELANARASSLGCEEPTRELFLELERMEFALAGERERAAVLLEEKAAQDAVIESSRVALVEQVDRRNSLLEEKLASEARSKQEVMALEGMLVQLMGDYERLEAIHRTVAEEVCSLKTSGVVGSSLIFAADKKAMLMEQETEPSTPRSRHTDEEPEMEDTVRSLSFDRFCHPVKN